MSVSTDEIREVGNELVVAADAGETRTIERLRNDFGMGTAELTQALDNLRENGQAVEVAPGEWRGPTEDEIDVARPEEAESPAGRVEVAIAPTGEPPADVPGERWEPLVGAGVGVATYSGVGPDVRLTRGIADRLDESALGAIVKAALESHEPAESFVLEVTP